MKKVRTWLTAILVMTAAVGYADGFKYLVVEQTDGATAETALASFDQIKFTDGQMVILNGGTTMAAYPLIGLKKMYFGEDASAIQTAEVTPDANSRFEVYSTSGILLRQGYGSLSDLPHGVYIVREGDRVRKVRK